MKCFLLLSVLTAMLAVAVADVQAAETPAGTTVAAANQQQGTILIPAAGAAAIGAGIAVFGAGRGIGNIGAAAAESTARQPEAAGAIRTAMILSAALIEGVALFGVVVALLAVNK